MTERYSFAVDRQLVSNISVDGGVVWNQDNIDTINATLEDTINEGYVTAEEDTQYLSVLDSTNEISLENLNITLTNPKLEVEETAETFLTSEDLIEQASEEVNDQQVVVYTVEGSEDLYGIQVVEDAEGNIQKYQFQFRKNSDGQLEAIPETIQLLPMEEVIQEDNNPENVEQEEENVAEDIINEHHSMHIFVQEDNSHEHILPDHNVLGNQEENEDQSTLIYENEMIEEESVDIKPGILALQNVKQELQEQQTEFEAAEEMEEETGSSFPSNLEQENMVSFDPSTETIHEEAENHLLEYGEHLEENSVVSEENSNMSETVQYGDKEATFVETRENGDNFVDPPNVAVEAHEELEEEFAAENNDSDVDDYHIVEGVHITGDVENETPVEPVVEKSNTNILRHALKTNKEPRLKKDNKLYLYVVQHPEKENVDSLSLDVLCKPLKTNPRSILKSSVHAMHQAQNEVSMQHEERLGKRFARGKEAVQARILHNFINKTTIPQVPERKNRLPRKQKIKPVERMDEEIVVQEVMVSSNGFVEASGGGINKENYMEVTDYVELTDSDDDYDPKRLNKKKKKHRKKRIEITISDDSSDFSQDSVIELDESDDETKEVAKSPKSADSNSPTKRRRGRPPKNPKTETKKSRFESDELDSAKPEIPCPKCDKTFPSQNSLKTHLQHHSLQSSLRNALPEYKYKCDDCGNTFKNNILLRKHACSKSFSCSVCKKKFSDASSLNLHKRIHAKQQLIKNTTIAQVSPRRIKSTEKFKSPKKVNNLKCKTCGKLCSSMQNLNVHLKTHKEYLCATCSTKFTSQLALEKHLRERCVKSPQGVRRSPRINSDSSSSSQDGTTKASKTTCPRVNCDKCTMKFMTYKALFKHKVMKHGLDTPDKTVLQESNKEKAAHGGVPPASRLRSAYSDLKRQLDFTD